jgi:DNA-binding beta-propeller fold protein YncE
MKAFSLPVRRPGLFTAALAAIAMVWRGVGLASGAGLPIMKHVADVPLPGGTTRFDYQSFDPATGRLYISHMGDGHLVVFDTKADKVIADLPGFPTVTGVLFVPELKRVYASAAGGHEVVVVDAGSLKTIGRVLGASFPDGLAYAPEVKKVYVSDESASAELVIDARTTKRVGAIPLGGEAGNSHYDPVSKHIFVAVQTRNLVAEIDPQTDKVIARHPLPGSDHPHGFTLAPARRLMFVSCQGNNKLLVVDMQSMKVTQTCEVGDRPDVLAFDPRNSRLYVATEVGGLSVFEESGAVLKSVGVVSAPYAHSVSVDPGTHRIYLPLKNVNGRPVLRIMEP